MNVKAMIVEKLRALGADGLCDTFECGCGIDDLAPCGSFPEECTPARKVPPPDGNNNFDDWYEPLSVDLPARLDANGRAAK